MVALADGDGNKVNTYAYSPRGVRILSQSSEPVAQPYRFAGGCQDPTGLHHFQARYYDASIGRFTQPDPSGQEKNPYLYAEGDPVNRIDPTGLAFFDVVGKGFDMYDIGSIAKDLDEGNYKDALATGIGLAAGAAAETACGAVAVAVSAPTAGVDGSAVGAACFGIGYGAGELGEKAATNVLN